MISNLCRAYSVYDGSIFMLSFGMMESCMVDKMFLKYDFFDSGDYINVWPFLFSFLPSGEYDMVWIFKQLDSLALKHWFTTLQRFSNHLLLILIPLTESNSYDSVAVGLSLIHFHCPHFLCCGSCAQPNFIQQWWNVIQRANIESTSLLHTVAPQHALSNNSH